MDKNMVDMIEALATGIVSLIMAVGVFVMTIKKTFGDIKVFKKFSKYNIFKIKSHVRILRDTYPGENKGMLATPFDGAVNIFFHSGSRKGFYNFKLLEAFAWVLENIISRMRLSGCDDGRYFIVLFDGIKGVSHEFENIYLEWPEKLKKYNEVVTIIYSIPDDLHTFKRKAKGIVHDNFHVVNNSKEAIKLTPIDHLL